MTPSIARVTALVLAIGVWVSPSTSQACICQPPKPTVLLPSATTLAPAAGPWLVLHEGDGVGSLRSELGDLVPLESMGSFDELSLCGRRFELLRPTTPLDTGLSYELSLVSGTVADSRKFRASSREPKLVERAVHLKIAHSVFDSEMSEASCADPKFNGLHAKGFFQASIELDAPALLFVELSATDTTFGQLVEGNATVGQGQSSAVALEARAVASLPQLDTTADCALLVIRDSRNDVVHDQELCPQPGETLESDHTLTVPEHLIREPGEEPEGCGCRVGRRDGSGLGAVFLLALAALRRLASPARPRASPRCS